MILHYPDVYIKPLCSQNLKVITSQQIINSNIRESKEIPLLSHILRQFIIDGGAMPQVLQIIKQYMRERNTLAFCEISQRHFCCHFTSCCHSTFISDSALSLYTSEEQPQIRSFTSVIQWSVF
jgi:hypothetical protein